MVFACLMRCLALGVPLPHALIARISQEFEGGRNGQATAFEKGEIMHFTGTRSYAENFLFPLVNHDLPFLGMAFLLAGVAVALFLGGRSTRCSLASTTMTVSSKEPSCKAFLPSK